MKIDTMTQRQMLDAMGSEASDEEADAMLKLLKASGHDDTDEIGEIEWFEIMNRAINGGAN